MALLHIERDARACFQVDEPVKVSIMGASSAIRVSLIAALSPLAEYGTGVPGRPKGFYPRLDEVAVYAMTVERITGKHCPLPSLSGQWLALDRAKTPDAKPPQ